MAELEVFIGAVSLRPEPLWGPIGPSGPTVEVAAKFLPVIHHEAC